MRPGSCSLRQSGLQDHALGSQGGIRRDPPDTSLLHNVSRQTQMPSRGRSVCFFLESATAVSVSSTATHSLQAAARHWIALEVYLLVAVDPAAQQQLCSSRDSNSVVRPQRSDAVTATTAIAACARLLQLEGVAQQLFIECASHQTGHRSSSSLAQWRAHPQAPHRTARTSLAYYCPSNHSS